MHSCGTVQSIIDEIQQLGAYKNSPLKLFQDDTILSPDLPIWDVNNAHPLIVVTPKIGGGNTTRGSDRSPKARKRARKGTAQRAARHRVALRQAQLTHEETTELMSPRERPLKDDEFKELEEMMDKLPSYKSSVAAQNAIQSQKEADNKRKVSSYTAPSTHWLQQTSASDACP